MINLTTISQGITASAGTNLYGVCMELPVFFGATSSQPTISIAYSTGNAFVNGSTVVIPCTATISLQYTNESGVVTRQQQLQEHFTLGISATALPATAVLSNLGQQVTYTKTRCCKSYGIRIDGSLSLVTTAPA